MEHTNAFLYYPDNVLLSGMIKGYAKLGIFSIGQAGNANKRGEHQTRNKK